MLIRLLNQPNLPGEIVDGQNIVIDFDGRIDTMGEPTVGSYGTETR